MKKKLTLLTVTIILTITVVITTLISSSAKVNTQFPAKLTEYNGKVVLVKDKVIIKEYDEIVIELLPDIDRKSLKNGIIINNEEELNSIIEDYDG